MEAAQTPIVVVGTGSLVASHLAAKLTASGARATFVGRTTLPHFQGMRVVQADLTKEQITLQPGTSLISLTPLVVTAEFAHKLANLEHLIALGSTSMMVKAGSRDPVEATLAARLLAAEETLCAMAASRGIACTILRPTLIWDGVKDRNVTAVARFIHRWGMFPVAGRAKGGRQPIFAGDVARACLAAVARPPTGAIALDLPGGETLSFRDMVARIFIAMGQQPRIVALPSPLLAGGMALVQTVRHTGYSSNLFARMNVDQVFNGEESVAHLGIQPAPFVPNFPWLDASGE